MKINKILILSLIFILTINLTVYGVDEIEHQEVITSNYFEYSQVGSSRVSNPIYDAVDNTLGFTKMSTLSVGRASYRFYWYFDIPNLSQFNNNKYMLLEVANGFKTNLLNNNSTYIVFYDINGNIISSNLMDNKETSVVNITINGVDFTFYQNYILMDFNEIEEFTSNVSKVAILQYFDSQDSITVPTLVTDLKLTFYNNITDVVVDLNNKIDDLVEQVQDITNNLTDVNNQLDNVNDKLDSFMNADIDTDKENSVNQEISNFNSRIDEVDKTDESLKGAANSYLNTSIEYNTSNINSVIGEFTGNANIDNLFNHIFSNPFLSTVIVILPLFWVCYIILYRG